MIRPVIMKYFCEELRKIMPGENREKGNINAKTIMDTKG